jgi:ABC-type transport system involved in multi-copper enzyme maturation permease subunit
VTAAAPAAASGSPVIASLGRITAFASLGFRESYRSRSFLVAIILNLLYFGLLVLIGIAVDAAAREEGAGGLGALLRGETAVRFLLWFALGGASTLALFVGVFSSVGAIATEIERGTILAIVARPVARWEIVLGKLIGYAGLSVAYLVVESLAIAALLYAMTGVWVSDIWPALALMALNIIVMVAVALLGSTRLSTVANAVIVVVLYLALTNTGILFGIGQLLQSDILQSIADYARFLLPVGPVSDQAGMLLLGSGASLLDGGGPAGGDGPAAFLLPQRDWLWAYELVYLPVVVLLAALSLTYRDLRGG